jgi:hypothetical protein
MRGDFGLTTNDEVRQLFQVKRRLRHPDAVVQGRALAKLFLLAQCAKHPTVHQEAVALLREVVAGKADRDLVMSESSLGFRKRASVDLIVRLHQAATQ